MPLPRVAIIGAGIAGLTVASALRNRAEVSIIEKSRGVGGRLATRRTGDVSFDHGAQFFTARSKPFRNFLQPWLETGVVQPWNPRVLTLEVGAKPYRRDWFEPHYVGAPSMTALPKALAAVLAPKLQWEVTSVERMGDYWWLHSIDSKKTGPFDWVVATAPAPQILQWFPPQFSGMDALQQVRYAPCFALMLAYTQLPELHWDVARVKSSPIDWIVRGNSRPDQHGQQTMLLHSTHTWAHEQQNTNFDNIQLTLRQALEDILNQPMPAPLLSLLHRWSYAATVQTTQLPFELDAVNSLAACGDWSVFSNADNGGARVEAAFSSANALAEQLLALPEFAA